ncbi:hypothetical protein NQ314_004419 [Rhamnusium bicolor]|uniref:Uncharacterized protein n=1 Tax=Rhamnusium bicolor TaxID=1586634 RepID=A0AAV8ZJX1_9CUCU|nr:hypothetical protein NQ314_004419 [Rhamnusium bicolor]
MCYKSGQADKLLELNGLRTRKIQPKFIPTIIFNNHFNETLQNDALRDLLHVVCDFLQYEPDACGKHINGGIVVDLI